MIKFDRQFSLNETHNKFKLNPVCLPTSSFEEEDTVGFMIGLGCQEDCKTNGAGPARYKKCATGVVYEGENLYQNSTFKYSG